MKRKQYNINKDFAAWNNMNPHISKFSAPYLQFFLRTAFKAEKSSEDCIVEKNEVVLAGKKVKYLIYTPANLEDNAPCLIYYHGGGFVFPAAPYHYKNARIYATRAKCKVIFPDYPLAPKYPFPIPGKTCFEFYKYVLKNADTLNINKDKIIVGGDSAGGCLSTTVCMMASDNNLPVPKGQMLIYPVVGIEEPTPSMLEFDDTGMCNNKDYEKYSKLYFASERGKKNRYASALNQEDLTLYPATYIETAEFDCLRDEAKIFAKALKEVGVSVSTHYTKGTIHGYDIVRNSPIVHESLDKRVAFLKKVFAKNKRKGS